MLVALIASLLLQDPTAVPARECLDDNHRDICEPSVRQTLLQSLSMRPAEDEARDGVESYRAFFVDGYGADMPSVAFERRPGSGPTVVAYGFQGNRLEAPVAPDVWSRVQEQARFADRALQPLPSEAGTPPPPPCLHAWTVAVEMTNSPAGGSRVTPVRRRFENTCRGELTTRYAFSLADEALKALPQCQSLDVDQQRNVITLLATCLGLGGDRVSAAAVRNSKWQGRPRHGLDLLDAGTWRAWLGTNGSPELTWAGETVRTDRGRNNNVAAFVVERLREHPDLQFRATAYRGVSSRTVEVEGVAQYRASGEGPARYMTAPYRQTWVWDPNLSDWMVSNWVVESFRLAD